MTGGPGAAATGELVCMVGGDQPTIERAQPVFDAIGSVTLVMGPFGSGMAAKLARNLVQYGSWLAAYEAQVLAEAAGVELAKLASAIRTSDAKIGGASTLMFRPTVAPFTATDDVGLVEAMRQGSALAHKDLAAALELGRSLAVDLPLAAMTEDRCDDMFGLGGADPAGRPAEAPMSTPGAPDDTAGSDRVPDASGTARSRGMAKMQEVYGFSVDPDQVEGPYVDFTVDHLFGTVWTRPGLDIRERRLLTIGMLAALDQPVLMEIQFRSALERGELTEEQVREVVVHLTHYVGWPLSTGINQVAERVIAERRAGDKS